MRKAKHMRETPRKNKIKKFIFLLILLIIISYFMFNDQIKYDFKSIQTSTTSEESAINTEDSAKENTQQQKDVVVESSEDEDVINLIENVIRNKNLNENNFSFFYYNTKNNKYYFYNKDTYFTAASTIKVPVAMYYYDKINNGKLTSKTKLLYTQDCYEEGSGTTASRYSYGESIPIDFLLNQSIVNSDNTAVNVLVKNLGQTQYRYDIAKYSSKELSEDFYKNNIISASYGYDVINYLYKNIENYSTLIQDMKNSSMGQYLKKYIKDYEIAHKYGSYNGYVHDYGIVFTDTPYLIGIFTKNIPNSDELIASISSDVLNLTIDQ